MDDYLSFKDFKNKPPKSEEYPSCNNGQNNEIYRKIKSAVCYHEAAHFIFSSLSCMRKYGFRESEKNNLRKEVIPCVDEKYKPTSC